MIDIVDAAKVCQFPQHCGADACHAEGESEKQAGDHTDFPREEFLGIDQDRREGRCQQQADDKTQRARPEQIDVRQQQREWRDT